MALNGVIALILLYFNEFDSFESLSRHSGWRQTYIVCRISSSTFGQNWPTLQRGFSAIAELLVNLLNVTGYSLLGVIIISTIRESSTCFQMSLRWIVYDTIIWMV